MAGSAGWIRLALVVAVCGMLLLLAGPTSGGQPKAASDSDIIPGRYIVMLKGPGSPRVVTTRLGLRARVAYEHGLWGFAGEFSDQALRRLRADPAVLSIEPDRLITLDDQTLPTGVDRADADLSTVAMIDGVDDALDADIAIIDTGIQPDHPDLRVAGGVRFIGEDCAGGSWADDYGHGTHTGGTAAAIDNSIGVVGVAPGARLWAVKVLDSSGSGKLSCIIAGVDWVTANAATIEVANMSLGGSPSTTLCQAISSSAAAGVVYAVSAGNNHADASTKSPANCADVLTTSAIGEFDGMPGGLDPQTYSSKTCSMTGDDIFACFSNYGPLVEIAAPGVKIYSTYYGSRYAIGSGTSMAAPHVTGAAALEIVEHGKPTNAAGAAAVRARVIAGGTAQDGPLGFTSDPDAYHEPLLLLRSPGAYDVAVTGVTAPAVIMPDQLVPIDVTLWHDASSSHTLSVSLSASGGAVPDSPQTVTLEPDSFTTVPFTWDTTGVLPGDYSLTAIATGPPGDPNAGNNSRSTTAVVRLPAHDVAVTALDAPSPILEGDQVPLQVTASNPGTFSETFSVSLEATGGAVSGSPQTLTLEPDASTILSFTWDTAGLSPGEYTLTATALLEGDANPDNDSRSVEVRVRTPEHDVAVTSVSVSAQVAKDSNVPVVVTATNPGTFSETFSVSLEATGGSVLGSPKEITLAAGGFTTLLFIWHTLDARPEPYTLGAEAEPVPGEVSISNNSLAVDVIAIVPPIAVVNSTADPGSGVCDATECTLREAITSANATPGMARIEFDISPGGPQTIAPLSRLPDITDAVTIDGTTQPGFAGSPMIELTGVDFEEGVSGDGLRVLSGYSTVRGLVLNGFPGDGIELSGQGGNVIEGNFIGLDMSGYIDVGNTGDGVRIDNIPNNLVGGGSAAERNVISGNEGQGIAISGIAAKGNLIRGNYVGTSRDGAADVRNGFQGIRIDNADANTIGGTAPGAGNVISGSNYGGLLIYGCNEPRPKGTVVQGNLIGTDASGTVALGNSYYAVEAHCTVGTIIGGTAPGAGNVMSGNASGAGTGLTVHSSSGTVVQGNRIGTDITGTADLGNLRWGVYVGNSQDTIIGGTAPGAANVISGHDEYGLYITFNSSGTVAQGNFIGTDISGTIALGNGSYGVIISAAPGTIIGGTVPGAGNVISANGGDGIGIYDGEGSASGSVVQGNFVGTDMTGTIPLGNSQDGISMWTQNILVGGTAPGEGNTIAYNSGRGVDVGGSPSTGNRIRGNSIHSNGGLGIDNWSGGNGELTRPRIRGGGADGVSGTACANCTVDIYSDDVDEGRTYHGATQADGAGNWNFSGTPDGPCVTATAIDGTGNTSEFAWPFAVFGGDCQVPPPWVILTPSYQDRFGDSLALGDVSGDGIPDVAVGATSVAYVFSGSDRSRAFTLNNPDPQQSTWFGYSVAVGDVNGDGKADIAVGGPLTDVGGNTDQGRAYVFSGADGSLLFTLDNPNPQSASRFGWSVAVGDMNGDGWADVAVGATWQDAGGRTDPGQVSVFSGVDGSLLVTLDSPNPQSSAWFGLSMAMADVDGDGRADIAVGATGEDGGGTMDRGRAYVISGADGSLLFSLDTPNPQSSGHFGASIAIGEVDGDGGRDVAVGADQERVGGTTYQGRAYVFSGANGSLLFSLDSPNPQDNPHFGRSVGVGDVDGDGKGDIAVGVGVGVEVRRVTSTLSSILLPSGSDGSPGQEPVLRASLKYSSNPCLAMSSAVTA